jgi:hypothetical protein
MRVLFAVFVLCMIALIWTAVAVARHIRRHETQAKPHTETTEEETVVVSKSDSE